MRELLGSESGHIFFAGELLAEKIKVNIWVCLSFSSCAKYLFFTNIQERLSQITFSALSIENNLLNIWARHWQSVAIARRWYPTQPAPWAWPSDRPTFPWDSESSSKPETFTSMRFPGLPA